MTDEQINAAIDKIKGFSDYECRCESCHPDWCNDLNAMHAAEKHLFETRKDNAYGLRLATSDCQTMWHVTARERAEAFLKTLGKWEEERE